MQKQNETSQNGSEPVKTEPKHAKLTTRSVIKLIDHARKSGVQHLKFGDFEVSFDGTREQPHTPVELPEMKQQEEPKQHPDAALFFDGV